MPDCYDHAGQVVWNASASELWRRTTIAIDRALTRHARMHGGRVRLSFGKVAEYQRRGLVHYHALIRLDGLDPGDRERIITPPSWASVFVLAHAVTQAIAHTAFVTVPHAEEPDGCTIGWGDPGKAADVRPVRAVADHPSPGKRSPPTWPSTPPSPPKRPGTCPPGSPPTRSASTPTTATPAGSSTRLGPSASIPSTGACGGGRNTLGSGGHFFTKSRRYTGTFTAERQRRIAWRRARAAISRLQGAGVVDLVDAHDQHTTDVLTELTFVGIGWHTTADAVLANTAAAMAREKRQAARLVLTDAM